MATMRSLGRLLRGLATRGLTFIGEHYREFLAMILFLFVALAIFAYVGWAKARDAAQDASDARARVSTVEEQRAIEQAAQRRGERIAKVVTCFNTARNRPRLTLILTALANQQEDPVVRDVIGGLIEEYETTPTAGVRGTPTRAKCVRLAVRTGVPFAAYDFDPTTGKLLQPPPEEGT